MKSSKGFYYIDRVTNMIEIFIALLLLVIVIIRVIEIILHLFGSETVILLMSFERLLSLSLNLIIGIEFIKMLYKHTPDSVADVLLFAIARQIVVYHEKTIDMLIGVIAIAGLFAAKKFLLGPGVVISKPIEDFTIKDIDTVIQAKPVDRE